jgi:hypothetical protein
VNHRFVERRAERAADELLVLELLGSPLACVFLEDDPNKVLVWGLLEIAHFFSL